MANSTAFINAIKGQAIRDMKEHGILASLIIAQAILESAWGESTLTKKANNLFGIKATNWNGDKIEMSTTEYRNGIKENVSAYFRKYSSWVDSVADHTKLLLSDRYKPLINEIDYRVACNKIYQCGYATDPKYPDKLIYLIEKYQLHEYDMNFVIERLMSEMDIKQLQRWLNLNGFTDENGNQLDVDGQEGKHTIAAKNKAKSILTYILK